MLMIALFAAAAAPGAKTMAMDDWHAMAITAVAGEAAGPFYLQVHAGTSTETARSTTRW